MQQKQSSAWRKILLFCLLSASYHCSVPPEEVQDEFLRSVRRSDLKTSKSDEFHSQQRMRNVGLQNEGHDIIKETSWKRFINVHSNFMFNQLSGSIVETSPSTLETGTWTWNLELSRTCCLDPWNLELRTSKRLWVLFLVLLYGSIITVLLYLYPTLEIGNWNHINQWIEDLFLHQSRSLSENYSGVFYFYGNEQSWIPFKPKEFHFVIITEYGMDPHSYHSWVWTWSKTEIRNRRQKYWSPTSVGVISHPFFPIVIVHVQVTLWRCN